MGSRLRITLFACKRSEAITQQLYESTRLSLENESLEFPQKY